MRQKICKENIHHHPEPIRIFLKYRHFPFTYRTFSCFYSRIYQFKKPKEFLTQYRQLSKDN